MFHTRQVFAIGAKTSQDAEFLDRVTLHPSDKKHKNPAFRVARTDENGAALQCYRTSYASSMLKRPRLAARSSWKLLARKDSAWTRVFHIARRKIIPDLSAETATSNRADGLLYHRPAW
ncbi:hypothetical protein E4U43_007410 [Claviceps pusilla]|uniref:Uncharacterized protein n=1 Tax=Claviceps pusilla TaxID=123648 RepID=A0A9P7ND33_9HYPO|nr:hypothetical protein E4U43_007410 [Claviceps pusilla]